MNAELLDILYNQKWMTPRQRRVFELKFSEGLKNYQIAMMIEPPHFPCSKETITRDLRQIKKRMAPLITEYFEKHPEYTMTE